MQQINVAKKRQVQIDFTLSFIAPSHTADNQTNGVTSRHPTNNETEMNLCCLLMDREGFRVLSIRRPWTWP